MRGFVERRRDGGFTLLEIMIVVLLLGVLSGLLMMVLDSSQRATNDTFTRNGVTANLRMVLNRIADYLGDSGTSQIFSAVSSAVAAADGSSFQDGIQFQLIDSFDISAATVIWSGLYVIERVADTSIDAETSINDNADNDGDGHVDEGVVRIRYTDSAGVAVTEVLGRDVSSLTFEIDGETVRVTATFVGLASYDPDLAYVNQAYVISQSIMINLRNSPSTGGSSVTVSF